MARSAGGLLLWASSVRWVVPAIREGPGQWRILCMRYNIGAEATPRNPPGATQGQAGTAGLSPAAAGHASHRRT